MRTLVLSHDMQPHSIMSWEEAFVLVYFKHYDEGCQKPRAILLEAYESWEQSGQLWFKPAVIKLEKRHRRNGRHGPVFNKSNVFTRDSYNCQYCGAPFSKSQLTFDHVHPKRLGGKRDWENILSACKRCNLRKGGRTPEQAGMTPLSMPYRPKHLNPIASALREISIPPEWEPYIPEHLR